MVWAEVPQVSGGFWGAVQELLAELMVKGI